MTLTQSKVKVKVKVTEHLKFRKLPKIALVCLFCLCVTLVYCGQTVGRIKMKLGMQVRFGPGHIVLDGTQLPIPQWGTALNFRPISVVAKWLHGSRCHLVWS